MNKEKSTKICAETIQARMNNSLPAFMIDAHLREVIESGKAEPPKVVFTSKAAAIVDATNETIEFETWSEVSKTEKTSTEKVGETFDLRQATMDFE
jgi:hypothetical protein